MHGQNHIKVLGYSSMCLPLGFKKSEEIYNHLGENLKN
jgi:hypothetical protein